MLPTPVTWRFGPLPPGHYVARVRDAWGHLLDEQGFRVATFRLSQVSASPTTIFGTVRHGYKDCTLIEWAQSDTARVRILLNGHVLKNLGELGWRTKHLFRWCGLNRRGNRLAPGHYRIGIEALYYVGSYKASDSRSMGITIDRKTVKVFQTAAKYGTQFASKSWKRTVQGGSCNWDKYQGSLLSTCFYAVAGVKYRFYLPPKAVAGRASVTYEDGLVACRPKLFAAQVGRTAIVTFISNGAKGWSQCWIDRVKIGYHYPRTYFRTTGNLSIETTGVDRGQASGQRLAIARRAKR